MCVLTLVGVAAPARALDTIELGIDVVSGEALRAEGVRLVLRPGERHHGLTLHLDALRWGPHVELQAVRVECDRLALDGLAGVCPEARVAFTHPVLGEQSVVAEVGYRHPDQLDVRFEDLVIAGGPVSGRLHLAPGEWAVEGRGSGLDLQVLAALSEAFDQPWPLDASGVVDLALSARGRETMPDRLTVDLALRDAAFSTADGLWAGEAIEAGASLEVSPVPEAEGGYGVRFEGRWADGGLYVHPVFVEAEAPMSVAARGEWHPGEAVLRLDDVRLDQPGVIRAAGHGIWHLEKGAEGLDARIELDRVDLPAAYEIYAQPFLPGTALDSLDTHGLLAGRVHLTEGAPREVVLNASRVSLNDRLGRFALSDLDAALHWSADGEVPASRVAIDGGHIFGIALGAARCQPEIERDGFRLPEPVRLPVLDGAVEVRDLRVLGLGSGAASWRFDGGVTPISMERLTAALNWPEMAGSLAGIIPDVRYEQGLLSVGGRLLVRAFDGTVMLGDLRLRDPLGVAPEFSAQIEIRGLDLGQMTQTFDVGSITGRLNGDVRDLVLVRWSPVQFDAVLGTPPGDTSRRRISQRAVDSLTRVGGGVGGVLSGGFMRIFDDFGYRHLGLSCRLEGEVCYMDGVAPAQQGYYIVQGSGLPRIDVIGYTRQVAWRDLVNRIVAVVTEEGAPALR